jgi:hypothetical protein
MVAFKGTTPALLPRRSLMGTWCRCTGKSSVGHLLLGEKVGFRHEIRVEGMAPERS